MFGPLLILFGALSVYVDLFRYRELFGSLFRRDLRAKYKGSVLGLAWSLANPVLLMLVYLLVFSVFWRAQPAKVPHYWLFLLCGLPAWVFFATSLQAASRSLLENANLIRKVRFPRQLVPLANVAAQLVAFAVMLTIVIVLSLIYEPAARDTVWLAIPLALLVVCLVGGVALAVASANAVFRDVEHLVAALLLPWFFLTPVLYSLDSVPGSEAHPWLERLIHWGNFVTPAIVSLREPLFFGKAPPAADAIYLAVSAVAALGIGAFVFIRVDDRIAVEV
jgi:homopolymeric O-antigen transport system permease protein